MVTGVEINMDKSVSLLLGIRRGKLMPPNNIVGHWTESLIKMLGVWFSLDLQIEKSWSEVAGKVTALIHTWSRRAVSLLEMSENLINNIFK